MSGNIWDDKIPNDTTLGMNVGGREKNLLSPYNNIVALLKETPYDPNNQKANAVGDKLSALLAPTKISIDDSFARPLNDALVDAALRARVAALTQSDPDKLMMALNDISGQHDGKTVHDILMRELLPQSAPQTQTFNAASGAQGSGQPAQAAAAAPAASTATATQTNTAQSAANAAIAADMKAMAKNRDFEEFETVALQNTGLSAMLVHLQSASGDAAQSGAAFVHALRTASDSNPQLFQQMSDALTRNPGLGTLIAGGVEGGQGADPQSGITLIETLVDPANADLAQAVGRLSASQQKILVSTFQKEMAKDPDFLDKLKRLKHDCPNIFASMLDHMGKDPQSDDDFKKTLLSNIGELKSFSQMSGWKDMIVMFATLIDGFSSPPGKWHLADKVNSIMDKVTNTVAAIPGASTLLGNMFNGASSDQQPAQQQTAQTQQPGDKVVYDEHHNAIGVTDTNNKFRPLAATTPS